MTRDGFSCFLDFQKKNFLQIRKVCDLFFNPTLLNTSILVKKKSGFQLGSKQQEYFFSVDLWLMGYKFIG